VPQKQPGGLFKMFKKAKPPKLEKVPKIEERTVVETVREASPLEGLRYANSIVKSSYLAEVVSLVVDKYLFYATGSKKISFDDAYRAITESDTKNYFRKMFNETVERRMQKIIREHLKQAGRLKEEETVVRKSNRFDGLAHGTIKDDLKEFTGETSEDEAEDSDAGNVL
jgi:hypothetical protein